MSNQDNNENKINIQIDPKVAEGTFSNLALIGHNDNMFILDFINVVHGTNQGAVKSRIIVTPEHAKRIAAVLQENIAKYEQAINNVQQQPVAEQPKSDTIAFNDIQKELN